MNFINIDESDSPVKLQVPIEQLALARVSNFSCLEVRFELKITSQNRKPSTQKIHNQLTLQQQLKSSR